jgi:transcription antitermination factor NusG
MNNFYCIWVRTGFENKFIEKIQSLFDSAPDEKNGKLHCIGKQIRLRSGKEFIDPLLPGYIFWETDNLSRIQDIKDEEGFIDFLPNDNGIKPLSAKDTELVTSFLKYGSVIPILNVQFDVNDRIVIVDGLFKGMEGFISDVNRSNKRINFEVTLMNGKRILSLSYQELQKNENNK